MHSLYCIICFFCFSIPPYHYWYCTCLYCIRRFQKRHQSCILTRSWNKCLCYLIYLIKCRYIPIHQCDSLALGNVFTNFNPGSVIIVYASLLWIIMGIHRKGIIFLFNMGTRAASNACRNTFTTFYIEMSSLSLICYWVLISRIKNLFKQTDHKSCPREQQSTWLRF